MFYGYELKKGTFPRILLKKMETVPYLALSGFETGEIAFPRGAWERVSQELLSGLPGLFPPFFFSIMPSARSLHHMHHERPSNRVFRKQQKKVEKKISNIQHGTPNIQGRMKVNF